jgi:hypothetical protein
MLLPGAEQLGMNHNQCLELLEGVEDTLNFLASTLTFLIHTESKKPEPDIALLTELEALDQEVFDVGYALAGSEVIRRGGAFHISSMPLLRSKSISRSVGPFGSSRSRTTSGQLARLRRLATL